MKKKIKNKQKIKRKGSYIHKRKRSYIHKKRVKKDVGKFEERYNQIKKMYEYIVKEREGLMKSIKDLNQKLSECWRSRRVFIRENRILIGEYNAEFNLKLLGEISEERLYGFVIEPFILANIGINKIKKLLDFIKKVYDKIKIINLILLSGNEERMIGINCGFNEVHFMVKIISIIQKIGFYSSLSEFYNIKIYLNIENLKIEVENE
jgi:hypothetical protein